MSNATNAAGIAERMFRIVLLVANRRDGMPLGPDDLARDFGCSSKTITRTVRDMREQCGFPIEFVKAKRAYIITDPSWKLPLVTLGMEDALVLALAREMLSAQGIPHRAAMVAALDKITSGLPPELKTLARDAATALAPPVLPRDYANAPITPLMEACSARHSVDIDYESLKSKTRKMRRVDPYTVEPREGVFWELHGWCHKNETICTFALDRVYGVSDTGDGFEWKAEAWEKFRREQGSRGLRGGPPVEVNAVFSHEAVPYALKRRWSDGLTITAQPDGTARLTGCVHGAEGFLIELLSWRRHVRVLGGPELRKLLAEEIRAMHALYVDANTLPDKK